MTRKKSPVARREQEYPRVERDGRAGYRLPDGAILWDDGEKEVPTSGLSDEQKRAEAMAYALGQPPRLKEGADRAKIAEIRQILTKSDDGAAVAAGRRAHEKKVAGLGPAKSPAEAAQRAAAAPPGVNALSQEARRLARKQLDLEIDRCEELKQYLISGSVHLRHGGEAVAGANPPMRLHETILKALRVLDAGQVPEMLAMIGELQAWQGADQPPEPADPGQFPPDTTPGHGSGVKYKGGQATGPEKSAEQQPAVILPDAGEGT